MSYIISAILGYLLGSIPFGLVVVHMAGLGDIRKIGSGNIGATNVLRTGRKDLALLTLAGDIGKAAFAAVLARIIFQDPMAALIAGTFGVIGHNFPVWLKFKGGKGVASTLGMMFATNFTVGLLAALTWLFMAVVFRYSSLSALTALCLAPIYAWAIKGPDYGMYVLFYGFLAVLSMIRHRANIWRLIKGEETQINLKKKK